MSSSIHPSRFKINFFYLIIYYSWLASSNSSGSSSANAAGHYFTATSPAQGQQPVSLPDSVNSKPESSRSFRRSKSSSRMIVNTSRSSKQSERTSLGLPSSVDRSSANSNCNNNKAVTFHAFATVQLVD